MILSCPNCATKYTLSEAQLGPRGRTVRCAACKTTWHAEVPEKPIDLSFSDVKKKESVEDLQKVKAKKLPLKYRAILEDKKRLKALTAQAMIWGGMGAAFVVILALGFFLRVNIVHAFPSVAGAYAMVGMKTNGTYLDFGAAEFDRGVKAGRFVITVKAQIKNTSNKPVPVPPVRVKLYDDTTQQFDSVLMPSGGLVVEPHATRTLVFDVSDPMNRTASLAMDFDLVAMKKMKKAGPNLRVTPTDHGEEGTHEEAGHGEAEAAADAGHEAAATAPETAHEPAAADAHAAPAENHAAPVSNHAAPPLRTSAPPAETTAHH
jgi:predicted Zn finger-like uncharacterized protein